MGRLRQHPMLARWPQCHESRFPLVFTACASRTEGAESRYRICYRPGLPAIGGGTNVPTIPKIGRATPGKEIAAPPHFYMALLNAQACKSQVE